MRLIKAWREAMNQVLSPDLLQPSQFRAMVLALVVMTGAVRLFAIGAPALDRTHWKEIDYIAISTNYSEHGFRFLRPEISWPAEEPRVTAMEFPLVPYLAALSYVPFGRNVYTVRWVTFAAFLLVTVYLARLARRELGPLMGLLSALAVSLLPLPNPFGRVLYSEPLMLAMALVGVFHWAEWLDGGRRRDWWLGVIGFSLAVALKAEPLYLLLPLSWLVVRRRGVGRVGARELARFAAVALVLPVTWYAYAYYLGQTSIDVFGVLRGHDKFQTLTMLSDPEWYRTMASRVAGEVLGGNLGTLLAVLGLGVALVVRRGSVFGAWLAAIGFYFCIVAEGNLDASYRQLHILPAIAPFVALGALGLAAALGSALPLFREPRTVGLLAACLIGLQAAPHAEEILAPDKDAPASAQRWILATEIRRHATPGTRIVTLGEYSIHVGGNDLSPVLYHYAGVTGWSLLPKDWDTTVVDSLRLRGAVLLAAKSLDREPGLREFARILERRYPVLYADSAAGLLLLDLHAASQTAAPGGALIP